ncbi:MAG: site-specific integrase [Chloroflexota bacterium]|nr:site-specific integrase [Chloroflexota bacterium]
MIPDDPMDTVPATLTPLSDHTSAVRVLGRDPVALYLDQLDGSSPKTARRSLRRLARLLGYDDPDHVPWETLRQADVAALRSRLQASTTVKGKQISPATANTALATLRGVLRAAADLGYMSDAEFRACMRVRLIGGEQLLTGRAARPAEIVALLDACMKDPSPAGVRDAAIIAVLHSTGMRRAELAALEVDDYHPESGELEVRQGKGRRQRIVYPDPGAQDALEDWIELRGSTPGPLFHPVNKGGRIGEGRISGLRVYKILAKRAEQARLIEPLTPHDLRRTLITTLFREKVPAPAIQALAGHAHAVTTMRYDRGGEEAKREAMQHIHTPYRKRDASGRGRVRE